MDIVVKGRRTDVPERFRRHVADKVARLSRLDDRIMLVDVEVTHEPNPRRADEAERVEITVRSKGPVVRSEAAAADRYGALDMALDKVEERIRRAADRRRDRRARANGSRSPAAEPLVLQAADASPAGVPPEPDTDNGVTTPAHELVVREKEHPAIPMTLDQALYEMELVGHDFYLFVDADTQRPSVVYRRRAYDYGVIRLAT